MIPLALLLRLGAAAAAMLAVRHRSAARRVAFIGSAAASLATGFEALVVLQRGTTATGTLFMHGASGFALTYVVDGLAAWFLIVLAVIAIPIAIYSLGYVAGAHYERRSSFMGASFNVLLLAVELVFIAGDALTFLCAWELMTLATAALVTTDHEAPASRRAAYIYLALSHVGTGGLIVAFMMLTSASNAGSMSLEALRSAAAGPVPSRDWLFALFFIGFGVKAGVIPLHVWLPEAHPEAPSSISALMSAVLIKTGVYGIIRFCAIGLGVPSVSWGVIVVSLGGLSAVLGVLYALMQHDLKRLLAYHSIENIGIILLGVGAGMIGLSHGRGDLAVLGFAAGLYHVLNHAVFKALLFLGAGGVVIGAGTRNIELLGGLVRRMPWTGLFFLIGAMAISGLPPLNGFASEWLTFQAFLFGFRGTDDALIHLLFPIGGALLGLTTALAAACFVKAFGMTFLALPRSGGAGAATESSASMLAPQAWLAMLCVVLGLLPGFVLGTIQRVLVTLPGFASPMNLSEGGLSMASGLPSFDSVAPAMLGAAFAGAVVLAAWLRSRRKVPVRRVPTWGCGGTLAAGTEYTATAFSKPLMMIFRAIYRPTRQVEAIGKQGRYFPQEVRYHAEIEPTFERYIYEPVVRNVMRLAGGLRVVQAGSLHAYLGYVIAMVVSLMLLVWWRS